jgi:hypothetical protein
VSSRCSKPVAAHAARPSEMATARRSDYRMAVHGMDPDTPSGGPTNMVTGRRPYGPPCAVLFLHQNDGISLRHPRRLILFQWVSYFFLRVRFGSFLPLDSCRWERSSAMVIPGILGVSPRSRRPSSAPNLPLWALLTTKSGCAPYPCTSSPSCYITSLSKKWGGSSDDGQPWLS